MPSTTPLTEAARGPLHLTDGAGFKANVYYTSDPVQRAALHARWALSPAELAEARVKCLRRERVDLLAPYGYDAMHTGTLPEAAPEWAKARLAEINAELSPVQASSRKAAA